MGRKKSRGKTKKSIKKRLSSKKSRSILEDTFHTAVQYYQTGSLGKAEEICSHIIQRTPDDFNTLNLLGTIVFWGTSINK